MIIMSRFDLEKEIDELVCPAMLKAGLKYFISSRKQDVTNKKEFDKVVNEFKNLKIGG